MRQSHWPALQIDKTSKVCQAGNVNLPVVGVGDVPIGIAGIVEAGVVDEDLAPFRAPALVSASRWEMSNSADQGPSSSGRILGRSAVKLKVATVPPSISVVGLKERIGNQWLPNR